MKRVLLLIFTVAILSLILVSCGPTKSDYNKLLNEKESLVKQNGLLTDSLKMVNEELNGYRYSPSKLCFNIKTLFKEDNLKALEEIAKKLEKYHPESTELKEVKSLCQKIISNRQRKEEEEKKKRMQAVNKLKKTFDDVSSITWYKNPYYIHYNDINSISIYIGKDESSVWLRLKMSYEGEDWIFFENAYLSYDGNTKEIYFNRYDNKKSDNSGGSVWEWIDVPVDNDLLTYLKAMVNGKSVKMRLSGKYTKTKNLSATEINGIKDVLLAYDVLTKGK